MTTSFNNRQQEEKKIFQLMKEGFSKTFSDGWIRDERRRHLVPKKELFDEKEEEEECACILFHSSYNDISDYL